MAVYEAKAAESVIEYENHPEGSGFVGVITECGIPQQSTVEYPNKDGSTTTAHKRYLIITNISGQNKTYTDGNGQQQTSPHLAFQRFQFYQNPDGTMRIPTDKSQMYQVWKQVLGKKPTFQPFDDEELVGRVILYGIEHNEGEGKNAGKTFANVTSMMPAPDQNIPEGIKLITQEQRAAARAGNQNGSYASSNGTTSNGSPATAPQQEAPAEGTAGHREHMKDACRKWIVYLAENEVYTEKQAQNFENFVNNENETAKLKEFCAKAEADCKGAFLTIPTPHPESTGGDDLPI